ncbi:ComEA family DNA-binding protein [Rathayibacter sp. YIM 133350]|uniref:ComEA family DNA-binding protein n=1 Tax=Rathayibacter sp. YIM 133350 TaxID=3131992 RepID=UPI00307F5232
MAGGQHEATRELHPRSQAPPRSRVLISGAIVLVVAALAAAVLVALLGSGGGTREVTGGASLPAELDPAATPTASASPAVELFVHVLGAVARPGLYRLPPQARVVDAVAASGGFTAAADQGGVNLARPVADGEQVYVPAVGEVPPPAADTAGAGGADSGAPINLNTASAEQLETLPHIGPALAQRILDWRAANGPFASVDDLREVAGIGEKTFADLAPHVTV